MVICIILPNISVLHSIRLCYEEAKKSYDWLQMLLQVNKESWAEEQGWEIYGPSKILYEDFLSLPFFTPHIFPLQIVSCVVRSLRTTWELRISATLSIAQTFSRSHTFQQLMNVSTWKFRRHFRVNHTTLFISITFSQYQAWPSIFSLLVYYSHHLLIQGRIHDLLSHI